MPDQVDLKALQQFFKQRNQQAKIEEDTLLQLIGSWLEKLALTKATEKEIASRQANLRMLGNFIIALKTDAELLELNNTYPYYLIKNKKKLVGLSTIDISSISTPAALEQKVMDYHTQLMTLEYSNKIQQHWLLLICNETGSFDKTALFGQALKDYEFKTLLDRIYVFDAESKNIITLKTAALTS
jgi:hypothetical protein